MKFQKFFLSVHLYVTMFFLPLLCLYAATGIIYMSGIRNTETREKIEISGISAQDHAAVRNALAERGYDFSDAEVSVLSKTGQTRFGSPLKTHVRFSGNENTVRAEIVTPGFYDKFLQIHKGKAGSYFLILGFGVGVAMFVAYISGLVFALKNPARRKPLTISLLAGVASVVAGFLFC